jgi:uncharacterized membrane protein YkvA (DUF1232 family)
MSKRAGVPADPNKQLSFLTGLLKQLRLVWLLFRDSRVSLWTKSVLLISLLYLVSPIDLVPLLPGLGQLDDLGVILLGMTLFVKLCPSELVEYYLYQLEYGPESRRSQDDDETIDTTYRVVGEE